MQMLEEIDRDMDKFYLGKHEERKIVFLCLLSCMTKGPTHTFLTGRSSIGKSEMLKACSKYLPKRRYHEFTRISSTALNRYMAEEEGFTWDGKVLAITELSGAEQASDVLRVLMSEGKSRALITEKKRSGEQTVIDWQVEGTPAIATTTASDKVEHQFATRCLAIEVSHTKEELRRIVRFIAKIKSGPKSLGPEPDKKLTKYINDMKEYDVDIPYGEQIGKVWRVELPRATRDISNFISLIKSHTVLNQAYREKKGNVLISNEEDYEVCREFARTLNENSFKGGITYKDNAYLKAVLNLSRTKKYAKVDSDGNQTDLKGGTIEDIMDKVGVSHVTATKHLGYLVDEGLLIQHKRFTGNVRLPFIFTPVVSFQEETLPCFDKLMEAR